MPIAASRARCRWVLRRSSNIRPLVAVMLLSVALDACSSPRVPPGTETARESAPMSSSCSNVTGQWTWFTGGVVTINPNGTIVHSLGNDGTWTCTDNAREMATLRCESAGSSTNLCSPATDGSSPAPIRRRHM